MQKFVGVLVILLFVFLFNYIPFSYCGDGAKVFNAKCCACHRINGEAPSISPVKYASTQWKRFFERNKHERKKDIKNEVSNLDMNVVKQYLIDHSADSDHPIAAGSTGRR